MKQGLGMGKMLVAIAVAAGFGLMVADTARAHCDTMSGPVVTEAKAALENGNVTPLLKWVKKDTETEVRVAFAKAFTVRAQGPDAKELADRYFLETIVRLHLASEGTIYTGIKDEPVEPIVAMADKALFDGTADEMIKKIGNHVVEELKAKFNKALEAKKDKDKNVDAGRVFVDAYVAYMHFVEGIHTVVMSPRGH